MSVWFCLCVSSQENPYCRLKNMNIKQGKTRKEEKNDRMKLQWRRAMSRENRMALHCSFMFEYETHGRFSNMPWKNEKNVAMSVKWMKNTPGEFLKRIHCHIWHHSTNRIQSTMPNIHHSNGWCYTVKLMFCLCLFKEKIMYKTE